METVWATPRLPGNLAYRARRWSSTPIWRTCRRGRVGPAAAAIRLPVLLGHLRARRSFPADPPAVRRTVDDLPLGGMRWLQRGSSVHPGPLPGLGTEGGDHPAWAPVEYGGRRRHQGETASVSRQRSRGCKYGDLLYISRGPRDWYNLWALRYDSAAQQFTNPATDTSLELPFTTQT